MCGITGIINLNKTAVDKKLLKEMNDIIHYRGPDDEGFYYDDNNGIGFGHRRLSILDLSELGHQPMCNDDSSNWIVFNGEIYNYLELMEELKTKGYQFKSHCDTEVILKAYEEWGENCVKHFNGMWAFAIWDSKNKTLFCTRDRFAIKPFYYYINNNVFLFASEIKQILLHPEYTFKPNKQAIYDFLAYSTLDHTEDTLYEDIMQLHGGMSLSLNLHEEKPEIKKYIYWQLDLNKEINSLNEKELAEKFYQEFYRSIQLRLRSDVPVGSCLSGGLDSSAIVCMVNKQLRESKEPFTQKTFSSCFEDKRFDEREFITAVEEKTGVDGYHVFPKYDDFEKLLEDLIWHQDGPVHSISMFAQREVFRLAKENDVTVMLDGQGGDEVLAGYHKFFWDYYIQLIKEFKLFTLVKELYHCHKTHKYSYYTLLKVLYMAAIPPNYKKRAYPVWINNKFSNEFAESSPAKNIFTKKHCKNLAKNWYYILIKHSNMPAILHYEDRNSMTSSIESRVPFLDYKLVEFLFTVPNKEKIKNASSKFLLRNAFKDLLPEKVINRIDKMGFITPDDLWLKEKYKHNFIELINSKPLKELNILNTDYLEEYFKQFCESNIKINFPAWKVITLAIWLNSMQKYCNNI